MAPEKPPVLSEKTLIPVGVLIGAAGLIVGLTAWLTTLHAETSQASENIANMKIAMSARDLVVDTRLRALETQLATTSSDIKARLEVLIAMRRREGKRD